MIKKSKSKIKSKIKGKYKNPSYLLGIATKIDDIEHELEEFLINKKVEVRFSFGKNSGGEISGKLEKATDSNLYIISNEGLSKIPTSFGSRRSKDRGYFYFHLNDVSFIDSKPHETPLIGIRVKST